MKPSYLELEILHLAQCLESWCASLVALVRFLACLVRVSYYKGEPDHAAAIYHVFVYYKLSSNTQTTSESWSYFWAIRLRIVPKSFKSFKIKGVRGDSTKVWRLIFLYFHDCTFEILECFLILPTKVDLKCEVKTNQPKCTANHKISSMDLRIH